MAVNLVLDNGNFPSNDANILVAAGLRVGSVGVSSGGAGGFTNSLTLTGFPNVPSGPGVAPNQLLLDGCYARWDAGTFTPPNTAAATATMGILDGGQPSLQIQMNQTAPLSNPGAVALDIYASVNTSAANSLVVARPSVSSASLAYPAGSYNAARTQVAGADAIACPTITGACVVKTWLAGLTGVVGATAVVPATVSGITAGTGFTLNGTIGAIYGYEVFYA